MNTLIENNFITEMDCGSNFSYILNDNSLFLPTEYKVLQSQVNSRFVKCMKMLYNGKIQLYYMTNSLKSFATMLPYIDADKFMTIIAELLADILDVKHNGFLSCQNIDISFERIYIDPTTYKVSLVYMPLSKKNYEDSSIFENELRTRLIKLISGVAAFSESKTMQLSVDLSDGTLSLEELYNRIKGVKVSDMSYDMQSKQQAFSDVILNSDNVVDSECLRIIAMNAPYQFEIEVTKDEFAFGKNPAVVDGVISFNEAISRLHCKVMKQGKQYTVIDLKSANGTYVNGTRLQPEQAYPVGNGDILRMANTDFKVCIE